MKKTNLFAVAVAVAVSTLSLASCTKQEQPFSLASHSGDITLPTSYLIVESNSMVTKANAHHAEIVEAIASCNPASIPIVAQVTGSTAYTEFNTGDKVTLKFNSYTLSATYNPASTIWLNSVLLSASAPFINVLSSATINESSTSLSIPATYECIAIVVPAEQVSSLKISCNGWQEMPSVVKNGYRITFFKGDAESSNPVMLMPEGDGYNQRQITLPKVSQKKGKYFYYELAPSGVSLDASASFSDWQEGTF